MTRSIISKMKKNTFLHAFRSRTDLKQYGVNALTLFAIQLFFNAEDIASIATDSIIVDGGDDGGIDLVYINKQNKSVVIAQDFISKGKKTVAPEKKARDLSHGLSLLLNESIKDVPMVLKSAAEELRAALENGEIEYFHIWYVHNLSGSKNVKNALRIVEHTADKFLEKYGIKVVDSLEVSADELENKWLSISTKILVKEKFEIKYPEGFRMQNDDWEAFVTSVPLSWLHEIYEEYKTDLFSANVRDYLGKTKRENNINNGIQTTAQNDPEHFWVFNNGITVLVNDFKTNNGILKIEGIAILNGAQTTGAIGNLPKSLNKNALVQVRFVKCTNKQTVEKIKEFNNLQNKTEAPDFRSKDDVQERLLKEFETTDVHYSPRRGGTEDIVKRKLPNTLSSILAGQILSAFHGRPDVAYHKKTEIWENDALYGETFNQNLSAKHIIFAFSLYEAIKRKRTDIVKKNKKTEVNDLEKDQLAFFETRGSVILLTAAISDCLQIFLNIGIPSPSRLEFTKNFKFEEAVSIWEPLIDIACSCLSRLQGGFSKGAIREDNAKEAIKNFIQFIEATKQPNADIYSKFSKIVKQR